MGSDRHEYRISMPKDIENSLPRVRPRLKAFQCLNWSKTPLQPCEVGLLSSSALSEPDSIPVQKRSKWNQHHSLDQ